MEHELGVRDLWFNPDGRQLATVTMHDRVGVWETATGDLLAGPVRLLDHALKSSFSPDGARAHRHRVV